MLHHYLQTEIALGSVLPLKMALNFMMSSMFFCRLLVQFDHVPEAWSKLAHRCWKVKGWSCKPKPLAIY